MKTFLFSAALLFCAMTAQAQMGEAEQKAMEEYASVGDKHKMLAGDNGKWKEETTIWMQPGAPPMTFKATVKSEMIMDGRFQQQSHSGDMMGMEFRGLSTTGYDNMRKVFVNTWIDNFSTGIMYSEGSWDPKKKSIEFTGKMTDPMAKGQQVPFRQVVTFTDNNHQRVEMYQMYEGKEFKSMEIKLERD